MLVEIVFFRKVLVDLGRLEKNLKVVEDTGGCPRDEVLAVVKEDAYGHGMVEVSRRLGDLGVKRFGVAMVEEGVSLRRGGVKGEVFVLGGVFHKDEVEESKRWQLTPVLSDFSMLEMVDREVNFYLKFDTGMGRLGFLEEDLERIIEFLKRKGLKPEGVVTHLSSADEDDEYTDLQVESFRRIWRELEREFGGLKGQFENSSYIFRRGHIKGMVARVGIALYGASPIAGEDFGLKDAMSFESVVWQVKRMKKGSKISYGGTYTLKRDSIVAVVPVGYAHGYPRASSGRAQVILKGKKVPVLGRVTMDWIMVDLTDLGWVDKGEKVVLMGEDGEARVSSWDLARWSGTIPYEIYCLLGSSNRRFYRYG